MSASSLWDKFNSVMANNNNSNNNKNNSNSKVNSLDGIVSLRADLRSLVSWPKDWQMLFNTDRCKVMHFGHNSSLVDYCMNSMQLQNVIEEI